MSKHAKPTHTPKLAAIIAGVVVLLASLLGGSATANAASGPTFGVMNTSETLPDGVYFRDSATGNAIRVTGFGVFKGEQIQASCYAVGNPVGPYGNKIWYKALNVSRPKVGSLVNEGWLNTHYVDDGQTAGHANPAVPPCTSTSTPTPRGGASVYYSPFPGDIISGFSNPQDIFLRRVASVSTITMYKPAWTSATACDTSKSGAFNDIAPDGRQVTVLSGWSLGTLGPIYFLNRYPDRARNIHNIILFDPGSLKILTGDCLHSQISQILQTWLGYSGANRLTIISGADTYDISSAKVGQNGFKYGDQGLWQVYFPKIYGKPTAGQVDVCDFTTMKHEMTWINFQGAVNYLPVPNTCPPLTGALHGPNPWHP